MKIEFWCVNKTSFPYIKEGMSVYENRLKHYTSLKVQIIPNIKNTKHLTSSQIKKAESLVILNKLNSADHLILLDENGKQYDSKGFAKFIESCQMTNKKKIIFLIGGGYGFDESIYTRSNSKISLSPLTFPHELVRVIFLEQLYRAFTIIRGEKYHHT